jgi:hypothetical protein
VYSNLNDSKVVAVSGGRVFNNPFIHIEDVWRNVGLLLLAICGIAELVAISLAEGHQLKKKLEVVATAFLFLYIGSDLVAHKYELDARQFETNAIVKLLNLTNTAMAARGRSVNDEVIFQNRARAEAARRGNEQPKLAVSLSPGLLPGSISVVISSINLMPFRYRYTVVTEGGGEICSSPDEPQDEVPNGMALLVDCRFVVEKLRDGYLELDFTVLSMPNKPRYEETVVRKYRLREDKLSLEPII